MPLTAKGSKIMSAMTAEYGSEKGKQVFYASKNAGKITGVDEMPHAAGLAIFEPGGQLLFVKRSGHGDHEGAWAFPGGMRESWETGGQCAGRETMEEVGWREPGNRWLVHRTGFDCSTGMKRAHDGVDFATYVQKASKKFEPRLNHEHNDYMWADPKRPPEPLHPGVKEVLPKLAKDMNTSGMPSSSNVTDLRGFNQGSSGYGGGGFSEFGGSSIKASSGSTQSPTEIISGASSGRGGTPTDTGGFYNETSTSGRNPSMDMKDEDDDVSVSVPLAIRLMEYAREDAPDDEALHFVAERLMKMRKAKMSDYKELIAADSLAFDYSSARSYDVDNRMRVEMSNISKANVCPYVGAEIPNWQALGLDAKRTYMLFRHPDELKKAAPTFNNLPLLSRHVPVNADDHRPDLVVGSTGTDAAFDGTYLKNSLVVWARGAIDSINAGEQKELSCAYRYTADMTPGVYKGVRYDGVMRNIIGNHVALVREGRAGKDVVVGDAALQLKGRWTMSKVAMAQDAVIEYLSSKLAPGELTRVNVIFDGVTDKNYAASVPTIVERIVKDTENRLAQDASIDEILQLLHALIDGGKIPGQPGAVPGQPGAVPGQPGAAPGAALPPQGAAPGAAKPAGAQPGEKGTAKPGEPPAHHAAPGGPPSHGAAPGAGTPPAHGATPAAPPAHPAAGGAPPAHGASVPPHSPPTPHPAPGGSPSTPHPGGGLAPAHGAPPAAPGAPAAPGMPPVDPMQQAQGENLAKLKAYLSDKVTPEVLMQVEAIMTAKPEPPQAPPTGQVPPMGGFEPSPVGEDGVSEMENDKITKTAMDEAIAEAVKATTDAVTKQQLEIRNAERAVRPFVGELPTAFDSAEAVYRAALTTLGVEHEGIHESALPAILKMQGKPGEKAPSPVVMDASDSEGFYERYPDARKIGHA